MKKLCRNCRYVKRSPVGWEFAKCLRTEKRKVNDEDPITGKAKVDVTVAYCSNQRNLDFDEYCGPEGKFFEQKVTILTTLSDLWNKLP